MILEIYKKKGNLPFKEKDMVSQIREKILKIQDKNPSFTFSPANNPTELERLYEKICSDFIDFEEISTTSSSESSSSNLMEEDDLANEPIKETSSDSSQKSSFSGDPFSENEMKVRGYVMEEDFETFNSNQAGATVDDFREPTTFNESFKIPTQNEAESLSEISDEEETFNNNSAPPPPPNQNQSNNQREREPINPALADMDSARKRTKTKRFAKQIVSLTCDLLERGFEWYAMKDITETKLTQYELENEMDLSILVELSNGQQATVKNFFLSQHKTIKAESKIHEDERKDLIDALTEVFLEKGIAPTPMQELLLVGARIVGMQVMKVIQIVSSNNSILNQLRGYKSEETTYEEEPQYNEPEEPKKPSSQNVSFDEAVTESKVTESKKLKKADYVETIEPFQEVATKE